MRKFISASACLILMFLTSELSAQRDITAVTRNSPFDKMIHFVPLPLFVGGMELGYEKATTHKESFYIQMGYYGSESANALKIKDDGYSNMIGVKLEMQYRFYLKTNNYKKNVWIAPFLNFKTLSAKYDNTISTYMGPPTYGYTYKTISENRSASTVSLGYMMGSRRSIFENIYLDASIGGGIFIPVAGDDHKELNMPLVNPYQRSIQFKANLGICIAL